MMQGMGMPGNFMQYAMLDQMDVIDGDFGDVLFLAGKHDFFSFEMVEDMAKGMFGMDVEDVSFYSHFQQICFFLLSYLIWE